MIEFLLSRMIVGVELIVCSISARKVHCLEASLVELRSYPTVSLVGLLRFQPFQALVEPLPINFSKTHQSFRLQHTLTAKMINAVLVFNNAGQPRLTKFYTQLVSALPHHTILSTDSLPGNVSPATSYLGDLLPCIASSVRILQFLASTASPRLLWYLFYSFTTTQ
jgi:hypothetical protein